MVSIHETVSFLLFITLLLFEGRTEPARWQQQTPEPPQLSIAAPLPGEALQGIVTVQATTPVEGFRSAEISFGYQEDPTRTWFLLQQIQTGVPEGVSAQWDTTTISDGTYRLRVQVFLQDGQVLESLVEGLRVRNYSPVETNTPAVEQPLPAESRPTPTVTPLPDFVPSVQTPMVVPANPAQLTLAAMQTGLVRGVGVVFGVLLLAGLYIGIKAISRR